ncbi:WecB/TagA/CpsF family glycosyltransferase [Bradyrhizobium ontarionense]|uniref:WecB/TagA/CpsF family glycosyltransferase n=1 Tax=Bradyrhizobium ontarionense TaxID=2898149 RepID=A0ABY3RDM2_9BRAD|nr:WecB/TagA/CpsF family glycosyltransferase [Bradyrhizobium sp. A19]UFZ04788.1 WecB/TagA/CpsF family glycosyltransferase [Bradyrhizobium sp. A19]
MLTTQELQEAGRSYYRTGRSGAGRDRSEVEAPRAEVAVPDDLSRDVYCVLGIPIDAIGMRGVLHRIRDAARRKTRLLISTPNLNFLVASQSNRSFRESLILSDLCTVDGMPVVWIARLIGIPIKSRTAGADIFEALKSDVGSAHSLGVFLFGGPEGAAERAAGTLNRLDGGLRCVGWSNPGYCSAEELSRDHIIEEINASGADFLVASLSSLKGQSWLQRNHQRLQIPVRAHLGAALNFQAGTVKRAPPILRKLGFEWLWRIKEEPYLWRRYWNDGTAMLRLLLTHVLPFVLWTWWMRRTHERGEALTITQDYGSRAVTLSLSGPADARHVHRAVPVFRTAAASHKRIVLDLSNVCAIDARFLGLLLMLRKQLEAQGCVATFVGVSPLMARIFRFGGLELQ